MNYLHLIFLGMLFKAKTHNIATIVAFYLRNHFGDYKILSINSGLTWAKSSKKKNLVSTKVRSNSIN
jgi:hypothetical protein